MTTKTNKSGNSQLSQAAQRPPGGNIMTKEPGLAESEMNVISDKFKNRKGGRKNRDGDESNHEEERQKKKKMIEEVNIVWKMMSDFL